MWIAWLWQQSWSCLRRWSMWRVVLGIKWFGALILKETVALQAINQSGNIFISLKSQSHTWHSYIWCSSPDNFSFRETAKTIPSAQAKKQQFIKHVIDNASFRQWLIHLVQTWLTSRFPNRGDRGICRQMGVSHFKMRKLSPHQEELQITEVVSPAQASSGDNSIKSGSVNPH